jgi:hypothetical protein
MQIKKIILGYCFLMVVQFATAQKYGDCVRAKEICKKDTYTFSNVTGEGRDNEEAAGTPCFMNGIGTEDGNAERNSTWIKFKIKKGGSLKFNIKPSVKTDDMDFVVYRLAGNDCESKRIVRCCASGDQDYPSPCMGSTGLRDGEDDYREDPGCNASRNSYLAPIKVKDNETYMVLVSNVTSEGNGFSIRFSGSCVLPCEEETPPKPKPEVKPDPKPTSPPIVKVEPKVEPKVEVPIKEDPKPTVVEVPTTPKEEVPTVIEGRKTVVNKTLAVKNRTITLKVWDNSIEDGDVISIYVNGVKKFSNIELKVKAQEFILDLEQGENIITAHVESFGRKEPNTAAIAVNDGKKIQKFSLNATKNLEESVKVIVE